MLSPTARSVAPSCWRRCANAPPRATCASAWSCRRRKPTAGLVIYDEAVRESAQVRVDLALSAVAGEGIEATGEVGDPDPFMATMDAVAVSRPDEIILSTHPAPHSGWLRRDLIERIQNATGLPVHHIVIDLEQEGLPFKVTLVIANKTSSGEELLAHLKEKDAQPGQHLFIAVVPQVDGSGAAPREARARLARMLDRLGGAGLLSSGMIGDPDPYTATMNALELFRVDDIVISTLPGERSGWLRSNLIERVRTPPRRASSTWSSSPSPTRSRLRPRSGHDGGSQHPPPGRSRPRRAPRPAAGQPQLARRGAAARDAAFHHLRGDDLRRVLHRLLLHPHRPGSPVAGSRDRAAGARRGRQHSDPDLLLVHAALGGEVDQERQPLRAEGGDPDDVPAGVHVPVHPDQRVRQHRLRPAGRRRRRRSSTRSPACTARTCSSGCCCC